MALSKFDGIMKTITTGEETMALPKFDGIMKTMTTGGATMALSKIDGIMKKITTAYEEFQTGHKCAAVEDQRTCQLLLEVAAQLTVICKSPDVDPSASTFVLKVVLCGNLLLNLAEISKLFFLYYKSIDDDKEFQESFKSDINFLNKIIDEIRVRMKDLGENVVKKLKIIKSILNVENTRKVRLLFAELIGEFDYHVHMIRVDIKRCQALLASIETKVNKKLAERLALVIGGSVVSIGSTVAVALLTNPITVSIGAVAAVAGGAVAGVQYLKSRREMRRIEELKAIKVQLIDYQTTIKSHVEDLNQADIPVDKNSSKCQ